MKKSSNSRTALFSRRGLVTLVCAAVYCFASATLLAFFPPGVSKSVFHRTLTFEQRVDYQWKIEGVYWRHRIWPKERTDSKPALEMVMSRGQIEKKVRDQVRNSRVLEDYWQQPVSSRQLQAEMERMAQQTKDPAMLRELFEALGNDPFVIAECLARPALSERLVNTFSDANAKAGSEPNQPGEILPYARSQQAGGDPTGDSRGFTGYSLPSLSGAASTCTDQPWSPVGDPPARRALHAAVWTGSEMIVWGGRNYNLPVGAGDRYNPATDSWSKVTLANAPVGRDGPAVWTGTEMIVWGGYQPGNIAILNSGGKYDPANDSWTPTSLTNAPTARYAHTAVWTGTAMLVWGGIDRTSYSNTGAIYDPISDSWKTISTTNAPPARFDHSAVWTGSEMIIWGGQGSTVSTGGAKYNPVSDSWTTVIAVNAPAARHGHRAVWTGNDMIIWGGYNGTYLSDGAKYNPTADTWVALSAANSLSGRRSPSAVWTGSEMVVWGGWGDNGPEASGGRYNPSANNWIPMTMISAPSGREMHTTVWTGEEMIVFGGGYDESLNDGGRYNPTADTWTPVRTTNTPKGRSAHTAVWTGSEMIVWGGATDAPILTTNTGGRYDPALDTWTPTNTVNAPEDRESHTAVWTGTEMIVWGGWRTAPSSYRVMETGGRYNPATDSWTPTSLTNAPTARRYHSTVWTGNEMIVWGGEGPPPAGANSLRNTGGRYNANTDSWIATNTTNAPTARVFHTGIWTGNEMIIFGGGVYNASNTGGRYNPASDTWTITSTLGAPTRGEPSAIWTGTEMIVWGGYNGSGHVNTGARYNPSADTWTPTRVFNAPEARIGHAAAWTGEEMIVWGGYNFQQNRFFSTGGRYRPSTDSWTATSIINAPHGASSATAVWTGSQMVVWGGLFSFTDALGFAHSFNVSSGGAYCPTSDPTSGPSPVRLANISTRAFVQAGDNVMIGGLIVTGSGLKTFIVRAIGPSLSNSGIADALQNPVLELRDSTGALLASNDNWMDAANKQAIIDSGLAPSHNLESAILTSLAPGAYTAVLRGVNNGTGTAVVEAYDLDQTASSKFGNISTRAFAQTADRVMIGGLIVTGSGSESVVVRAIGPSLTQFGVADALADPLLELRDSHGGLLASNDNWMDASNKQAIIDNGLAPSHNLESAILTSLNPGSYTAIVQGMNGTGVALVEVFGLN